MPALSGNATQHGRYFRLATDQVAAPERREFWRDTALNRSEADFPAGGHRSDFAARVHGYVGAGGELREGFSDALTLRRTAARCRQDAGDEVLLSGIVSLNGEAHYQNATTSLVIPPGRFLVNDMSMPFSIDIGRYRSVNFRLPRAAVALAIQAQPARLNGRLLPDTPLIGLLFAQLVQFADALPAMTDAERQVMLASSTELALATLRLQTRLGEWEPGDHSTGLWLAVQRYIERNLGAELTPEVLARALRCSRTHLYRVFRRHGVAVMDHVREVRLERSRAMLTDPSCPLPIAEIAALCGLDNPSAFSRSFRERYGCTPADVRRQSRGWPAQQGRP